MFYQLFAKILFCFIISDKLFYYAYHILMNNFGWHVRIQYVSIKW